MHTIKNMINGIVLTKMDNYINIISKLYNINTNSLYVIFYQIDSNLTKYINLKKGITLKFIVYKELIGFQLSLE